MNGSKNGGRKEGRILEKRGTRKEEGGERAERKEEFRGEKKIKRVKGRRERG